MKQSIVYISIVLLVSVNLWGEERSITFTLSPEAGVVQFEIELWKQPNLEIEIPLRVIKNPGRVELKVPDGYEYFRAAGVAKRQIRGFWSELISVSSFGKKGKPEKRNSLGVKIPNTEESIDVLVPIQTQNGEVKQYLTAKRIRIVPTLPSDKKVSYFYRFDGGNWIESVSPEIEISDEGYFSLEFKSIDILGNKEAPKKMFFYVDKTPPTTSILLEKFYFKPIAGYFTSSSNSIWISAIDRDSGVKATYYQPICESSNFEWILLDKNYINMDELTRYCSGSMKVKIFSMDQVGNKEEPTILQINIQSQTP